MDMIDINLLKCHPMNKDIYGDEDVNELAEKIKKSGFIKPLLINKDNVIISGHRRWCSCLKNGIEEVPYERIEFNNATEELERLLLENEYREKTTYQKSQEASIWAEIEKEKAKQRQGQRNDLNNDLVDNVPPSEKGKSRDIIAKKVGLGSGKTYERAKAVVNEIDKLKEEGKEKDSEFLKTILNESVGGAKDLVDSNALENITEDIKDKIINKEIPVKKAIQEIKKDIANKSIIKDNENNNDEIVVSDDKEIVEGILNKDIVNEAESKLEANDVVGNSEIKAEDGVSSNNDNETVEEFKSISNEFVKVITKFNDMEEIFESMKEEDKEQILSSIDDIENAINNIKNNMVMF